MNRGKQKTNMPTTSEHRQPSETVKDRSYPFGYNLNVLRAMLGSGEIGSSGPQSADNPEHINPDIIQMALVAHHPWEHAETLSGAIANEMNKLAERGELELGPHDSSALASEAARVVAAADYPDTKSDARAVARLTVACGADYAENYFGHSFVDELRGAAGDNAKLAATIEGYYSTTELLRLAGAYRRPIQVVREAVDKVVTVAADRRMYMQKITHTDTHTAFADALSDKMLLRLAGKSPKAFDGLLSRAADAYQTLCTTCPLMSTVKASNTIGMLLDAGHTDYEKTIERVSKMEAIAERLVRDGLPESTATSTALRTGGDEAKLSQAVARQVSGRLYDGRPVGEITELRRRMDTAYKRGVLTPEDAGAVLHGTEEYRDLLLRVDEADVLTDDEKRGIFAYIRHAREQFSTMMYGLEAVLTAEMADSMRRQFDRKLTNSLYGIRYVIDHGVRAEQVTMGSKVVQITEGKDSLIAAQHQLAAGTHSMNALHTREAMGDPDATNLELATVPGSPALLIMTKRRRAPVETEYEQGKAARICLYSSMTGEQPSLIAKQRVLDSLCIRIDRDSDGMVRLDIGGKTDNPNTPDFMVARMLSLGEWYRAQLRGTEATDYHIDLMEMTEDQFAALVDDFREQVEMMPIVRVGEPVSGATPDQVSTQIVDGHRSLPGERPAA